MRHPPNAPANPPPPTPNPKLNFGFKWMPPAARSPESWPRMPMRRFCQLPQVLRGIHSNGSRQVVDWCASSLGKVVPAALTCANMRGGSAKDCVACLQICSVLVLIFKCRRPKGNPGLGSRQCSHSPVTFQSYVFCTLPADEGYMTFFFWGVVPTLLLVRSKPP